MRIDLAAWSSMGLRCPDVELDLRRADGTVPRVSLVQMPNGTGKTTMLRMLNATLSGAATRWNVETVRSYRRPEDRSDVGRFKVTLLIDTKPLTLELTLDYASGQVAYMSTSPGSGGVVPRWHVPPAVHKFLDPDFLRLFIFDGEFAHRLLNSELGEADRAVDALCQLYFLQVASDLAKDDWDRRAKTTTGKTASALAKWRDTQTVLSERRKSLTDARTKAAERLHAVAIEIAEAERRIAERLGSVETTRAHHEAALLDQTGARAEVATSMSGLMSAMRLPHALHPRLADQLVGLRDNLDRLKLPENTSAQFFDELVREDLCICGRPMDEHAVGEIRRRALDYLDSEEAGIINAMKRDIEAFAGTSEEDAGFARVVRLTTELGKAVRREKVAEGQVRALRQQLIASGDEQLELWQHQLDAANKAQAELKNLIDAIDGPGDPDDPNDKVRSLSLVEKRLEEAETRIAEASQTARLREQTRVIQELLDGAAKKARGRIRAELLSTCNERLASILVNDPLRIERIDRSIRLVGQDDASVGQTLSVGYTFLMSVLERGSNNFPLVVDSPANPIDHGVRRRIGKTIPRLCSQFVGFTINTERPGFVDALEAEAGDVEFLTLFRKTEGTRRLIASLPVGGFVETGNAVLVRDRAYFHGFDMTDEEDGDAVPLAG